MADAGRVWSRCDRGSTAASAVAKEAEAEGGAATARRRDWRGPMLLRANGGPYGMTGGVLRVDTQEGELLPRSCIGRRVLREGWSVQSSRRRSLRRLLLRVAEYERFLRDPVRVRGVSPPERARWRTLRGCWGALGCRLNSPPRLRRTRAVSTSTRRGLWVEALRRSFRRCRRGRRGTPLLRLDASAIFVYSWWGEARWVWRRPTEGGGLSMSSKNYKPLAVGSKDDEITPVNTSTRDIS